MSELPLPARWPRARQPRMAFLVLFLVLSLVFTAVLAYQAWDAARSHRAISERALRDYAAFAALEFTINSKEGIWGAIQDVLYRPADLGVGAPTTYHGPPGLAAALNGPKDCPAQALDTAMFIFRLDLAPRRIPVSRGCASAAVRAWLADTIPPHAVQYYKTTWDHPAYIVGRVGGVSRIIAYTVRRDTAGVPCSAYGFVTTFAPFAGRVFADIQHYYPFFPKALVAKTPNDSMLSVVVRDSLGGVLYRSPVQYPATYAASDTMHSFGGYVTTVALRPEVAEKLVIGGLPRSRLPLLLSLLAVSAVLVVASILLLRREYELARLRSDFISSISHELRTPLAQVRMFSETLRLGRVRSDGERQRSLEIIDQEARRLTHLVENVLHFSRSERRLTRIAPEPTELASQLRETIEAFAPIARARRAHVVPVLEEGLVANVDRGALRQVVVNLLDNAVKYGPAGQEVRVELRGEGVDGAGMREAGGGTSGPSALGPRRSASAVAESGRPRAESSTRVPAHPASPLPHPDLVEISISDQGPGIPSEARARIFEPFFRLERDANSAVAGSGIGLAVVTELVHLHQGRVHVERAPGGGARFVVVLPAACHERPAEVPALDAGLPHAEQETQEVVS